MAIARTQARALTILALAVLLAAPAAAESVGFLALAEGDVQVQPSGATSFVAARTDSEVSIGDTIRTGRDSLAKLVLVDDTILTIDEETELQIDQYVVGPSATSEPSRINLVAGQLRTKVGEAFGGATRLQVHTPTAVIGVKGTEWVTWYLTQLQTTFVCVVSGIVTMESSDPGSIGSFEPPVGSCAKVLPHLRPEPAELPTYLNAIQAVQSFVGPGVVTPPVGAGPEGGIDVRAATRSISGGGLNDPGDTTLVFSETNIQPPPPAPRTPPPAPPAPQQEPTFGGGGSGASGPGFEGGGSGAP